MSSIPFALAVLLVLSPGCRQTGVVHKDARHAVYRKDVRHGVYHVVERHQTLWRICKTYGVDMERVARINGIKDKTKIKVGQRIFMPGARKVLKVDVYIEDVTARRKRTPITYAKGRFIWPAKGQITSKFSVDGRRRNDGIDISAPPGTPVVAANRGRVVYSDNKIRGYGNLIIIEHKDGFFSVYAHSEVNLVKEEARVKRGEVIARIGNTGHAKGSHLHFEIRKGSRPLNPLLFLP